ncbi:MAG: thiamine phosphate synthase [Taibaiella sp.]|nr:thiamine phosphate synthase [Taibaiella sp.]
MIIVLTPEQQVPNEQEVLRQMFEAGLQRFHIRKYWWTDNEMKAYLDAIDPIFHQRLVLHSHYNLANDYGINRLHFREEDRLANRHSPYKNEYEISTSVHEITAFNDLDKIWRYAFLSPMFPSISKQGYGTDLAVLATLSQRNNKHCQLIGLGGIDEGNFEVVIKQGADGIALLGGIWQAPDPVAVYTSIQSAYGKL